MSNDHPPAVRSESRALSEFLCFAIYSANLAFGKAYKPILEELGLTYTQYIAIIALCEEDQQTVSGLGEKLFLESNTLTPILKKLESLGYLQRQRDTLDERQVRISLTEAGRKLLDACGLTKEEFPKMQASVVKLRNSLLRSVQDQA